MTGRAAYRIAILWIAIFGFWQNHADAWIESQVKGHSARIEVGRDGDWIISHELVLKLRGGPMKTLEIAGIGSDIQPLPNAVVRRAEDGSAGVWPVHLSSMEDGALRLGISAERGLRGGTYVFSFGYRAESAGVRPMETQGGRTILTWVGPRLSSGVDSARVTFAVPHAQVPPDLAAVVDGPSGNVLLGEVRRGVEVDEIDLIRAHVANGEPAVWRIAVDGQLFGPRHDPLQKLPQGARPATSEPSWKRWSLPWSSLPWILAPTLLWLLLVFCKDRAVVRAAQLVDARAVPLLPMPTWTRSLLAAASVAGLASGVFLQRLVAVLGCLLATLLLTTYLLPVRVARPRGPGQWKLIEHLPKQASCSLPGAWFDVRSARGCLLFLGLMALVLGASYRILPRSNYLALMTLLTVPALLPLFFSGTRRDYPRTAVEQARPWYQYLKQTLDPRLLGVELWGRSALRLDHDLRAETRLDQPLPPAAPVDNWDEMRVRVILHRAPQGLRALEVVFEERAGAHLSPAILLRVREDSAALACLPKDISWQRGRAADERVAILSPTVPTFAQTARLLRSLAKSLSAQSSSSSARKSAGKGHVTGAQPSAGMAM